MQIERLDIKSDNVAFFLRQGIVNFKLVFVCDDGNLIMVAFEYAAVYGCGDNRFFIVGGKNFYIFRMITSIGSFFLKPWSTHSKTVSQNSTL